MASASDYTLLPKWVSVSSSWVTYYRVLEPGLYRGLTGEITITQLQLKFNDGHEHAYEVPHQVLTAFLAATSKGKFVHRVLLGKGWTPQNHQSRYKNWPLN